MTKLEDLTALTQLSDTDLLYIKRLGSTHPNRKISVSNIAASETQKGLIERATIAEVQVGLDTERAVTPDGLKAYFKLPITIGETSVIEGKITFATHKVDEPITAYMTHTSFLGYEESIFGFGYNMDRIDPAKHQFFMAFETDYQYAPGEYAVEWYIQLNNTANTLSVRPFFGSWDLDTLVGVNDYSATIHRFYNVDRSKSLVMDFGGTPPGITLYNSMSICQNTNNIQWLYQRDKVGTAINMMYMGYLYGVNYLILGTAGYPIWAKEDICFYEAATDGIVLSDRSDGRKYRIKSTNGVLGTEVVA